MSWFKALVIALCIFWAIQAAGYILFVWFGLGYTFSNLANALSEVLAFPTGTGKNYNILIGMFFWTAFVAVLIKTVIFLAHFRK